MVVMIQDHLEITIISLVVIMVAPLVILEVVQIINLQVMMVEALEVQMTIHQLILINMFQSKMKMAQLI